MAIGAPPGFQRMLDRKYDILAQKADADTMRARSAAGLQGAQAGEIQTRTDQLSRLTDLLGTQGALAGGLMGLQRGPTTPDFTGSTIGGGLGAGVPRTTSPQNTTTTPRTSTRRAPGGFGLASDDTTRRRVSEVFGSIFSNSRGF